MLVDNIILCRACNQIIRFFVEGYDTSLPLDYVKGKLYEHFSKCGSIRFIISVTQKEHGGPLPRFVASIVLPICSHISHLTIKS